MPIHTALWKVGQQPQALTESVLASEQLLEDMIVSSPNMLSDEWMLIGRQENTGLGGIIDLLAIAPDSTLVLIEIKRDKTPREVVAQALDYATWVDKLQSENIAAIYSRFVPGGNLSDDFKKRFGQNLDEENLNSSHQIIIVAATLDARTERIVGYLSARDIAINVLCFQIFSHGTDQFLSRSWLLDPVQTQANVAAHPAGTNEPWNGEFYCSFGDSAERSWEDAVEFGFICAGGGSWYTRTLQLLSPNDRIWVNVPGTGYVGVGVVTGAVEPVSTFQVTTLAGLKPILDVAKKGHYHVEFANDLDKCEYFVPVKWLQTVPLANAIHKLGMFGNQNSVCRPTAQRWRITVDRLKELLPNFGSEK